MHLQPRLKKREEGGSAVKLLIQAKHQFLWEPERLCEA